MIRFINDDTVLVNHYYKSDSVVNFLLKQAGLKTEFIDYEVENKDKRSWAYLNFLQTKDLILLPKFGIEYDKQALDQVEDFYPDYKGRIAQIDITEIVKYGGALNCISWTIKE